MGENRCEGRRVLDRCKEATGGHRRTRVSVTHGTGCCPGTVAVHEHSALTGQLLQSEKCRKPALGTANPEWSYGRAQSTPSPIAVWPPQSWASTAGPVCRRGSSGGLGLRGTKHTEMAVSLHGNFINTCSNLSLYVSQWLWG